MRGFGNVGGLGDMGNLMKQAQKAMARVQKLQEEMATARIEGSAGGGMVRVIVNGTGALEEVFIDPQVVDPEDLEMLQDLIVSAARDAAERARQQHEGKMREVTSGLGLPPGMF